MKTILTINGWLHWQQWLQMSIYRDLLDIYHEYQKSFTYGYPGYSGYNGYNQLLITVIPDIRHES